MPRDCVLRVVGRSRLEVPMIKIDGRHGEGGGQILRTSLALSLLTGKGFALHHIRGRRRRSGLLRQHLTCVRAAQAVGGAQVQGAELHSTELVFRPGRSAPGQHHFAVGSAGSTSLVLQSVLPVMLELDGVSRLEVEGGTHAMAAPSFHFLDRCYLPVLHQMGAEVSVDMTRPGFFPAGGGQVGLTVAGRSLQPLHLGERGDLGRVSVHAWSSGLPRRITQVEVQRVRQQLDLPWDCVHADVLCESRGPGNVVWIEAETTAGDLPMTALFTGFGRRGVQAEQVADDVLAAFLGWRDAGAAVCTHLADQLVLPMAVAGSGSFLTSELSQHTRTNIDTIQRFLPDTRILTETRADGLVRVTVG